MPDHQRLEFFRLEARRVVRAFHLAIERDVALDQDRAHRNRADRNRDAALVAGIADEGMDLAQRFHEAQMDVVKRGRVGALAMQQHIRRRAVVEEFRRGPDFIRRAHAGRDDQRLAGRGEFREQGQVGQIGGGDLVGLDAERLQRRDARRVPGRAEVLDVLRGAIGRDAALLLGRQFEAAQQVERVFDGEVVVLAGKAGGAIDLVQLAHLEFGAIRAGGDRGIDQRDGAIEIAVMVVADFRDDITRLAVADQAVCDLQRSVRVSLFHK